jgi:hypothetical protein
MVSEISEGITWEICPRCGRRAAVGWSTMVDQAHEGPWCDGAIEVDCQLGRELPEQDLAPIIPASGVGDLSAPSSTRVAARNVVHGSYRHLPAVQPAPRLMTLGGR